VKGITLITSYVVCLFLSIFAFSGDSFQEDKDYTVESRRMDEFENLCVDGAVDVFLRQGEKAYLEIQADNDVIERVITKVEENVLSISLKKQSGSRKGSRVTVFIIAPKLTNIETKGSGNLTGDGLWNSQDMNINTKGSGNCSFSVNGEKLNIVSRGSGSLRLTGSIIYQDVQILGSGNYSASLLQSESAFINISGSGKATLSVKNELDAKISGSGSIYYEGSPKLTSQIQGSGKIQKL
jgi:hypothetical protein